MTAESTSFWIRVSVFGRLFAISSAELGRSNITEVSRADQYRHQYESIFDIQSALFGHFAYYNRLLETIESSCSFPCFNLEPNG